MRPARAMLEALGRAGVSTQALNGAPPCGPGLLFFTEVTAPLCEFVRAASRHGLERLLAISLSPAATAGGGAWRLLREGAADVFAWDHSADPAREVAARFERWGEIDRLLESPMVRNHLAGESAAWIRALRQVVEVAHFTEAPVLIVGESGTGKELVARLIHALDARPRNSRRPVAR